jgi:hypothetical protein
METCAPLPACVWWPQKVDECVVWQAGVSYSIFSHAPCGSKQHAENIVDAVIQIVPSCILISTPLFCIFK